MTGSLGLGLGSGSLFSGFLWASVGGIFLSCGGTYVRSAGMGARGEEDGLFLRLSPCLLALALTDCLQKQIKDIMTGRTPQKITNSS